MIFKLDYSETREHESSGPKRMREKNPCATWGLKRLSKSLGPSFGAAHLAKSYEKERKRKIPTYDVFANAGQD